MVKLREQTDNHLVKRSDSQDGNVDNVTHANLLQDEKHLKQEVEGQELPLQCPNISERALASIEGLMFIDVEDVHDAKYKLVNAWLASLLPFTNIFYNQFKTKPIKYKRIYTFVNKTKTDSMNELNFMVMLVHDFLSNHLEVMFYTSLDLTCTDDMMNNNHYNELMGFSRSMLKFVKDAYITSRPDQKTSIEIAATSPALYQLVKESEMIVEKSFHLYNVFTLEEFQSWSNDVKVKSLPEGYRLTELRMEDAELLNDHWLYKTNTTIHLVREWIRLGYGRCIKYKQPVAKITTTETKDIEQETEEEIVCWSLVYDYGAVGLLYNLESHRGLGLAKIVIHDIISTIIHNIKEHRSEGTIIGGGIYCHIYPDNQASKALFTSLGLTKKFDAVWNMIDLL